MCLARTYVAFPSYRVISVITQRSTQAFYLDERLYSLVIFYFKVEEIPFPENCNFKVHIGMGSLIFIFIQ